MEQGFRVLGAKSRVSPQSTLSTPKGPKYLYYMVECGVSMSGTTIMIPGRIPHNST